MKNEVFSSFQGLSSLKPVWHDDDDDNLEVNLSYKRKSLRRITDGDNRTITGEVC